MSNVAIVYWSGTGNTEAMADFVAEGVEAKGGTATIIQAADFGAERVPEFDTFAFGCPAMGDEELEDTEFLPMYDEVEPLMAGEKVGFFGSYDWNNGEWMDYWMQRAEEAGVQPVETVIAKDYPDDEAAEASSLKAFESGARGRQLSAIDNGEPGIRPSSPFFVSATSYAALP